MLWGFVNDRSDAIDAKSHEIDNVVNVACLDYIQTTQNI